LHVADLQDRPGGSSLPADVKCHRAVPNFFAWTMDRPGDPAATIQTARWLTRLAP
jgi:hypothetical protein